MTEPPDSQDRTEQTPGAGLLVRVPADLVTHAGTARYRRERRQERAEMWRQPARDPA